MRIEVSYSKRADSNILASVTVIDSEDYPTDKIFGCASDKKDRPSLWEEEGLNERSYPDFKIIANAKDIGFEVEKEIVSIKKSLDIWRDVYVPDNRHVTL